MVTPQLLKILRENHDEVVQRWLDNCNGRIAEEFQEMLRTPMGAGIATSMFSLSMEYLEAEDYEATNILRRVRDAASNSSFRRAAVGFNLPDIVTTAIKFRDAMQETLINHYYRDNAGKDEGLLECIIKLMQLGDALVAGEIAGFFTFSKFGDSDEEIAAAI